MRRCSILTLAALALPLAAGPAAGAPPAPISPTLHPFPGAFLHPASARSAGCALADRWLGTEPFDNPAGAGERALRAAGVLQRTSRQDLRRENRRFDDQPIFVDAAGGALGVTLGPIGLSVYAMQPVLRVEDNAFSRGTDPFAEPATLSTSSAARELRAGAAVAGGFGPLRAGIAAEWTRRDDRYEETEQSGSPLAGVETAEFSGTGVGGVAGIRLDLGDAGAPGAVRVGGAFRFIPELDLEGESRADRVAADSQAPIVVTRDASWEAGGSLRVTVTPAFHVLLGAGGHGEQAWEGFGVARGRGSEWSAGAEFHDARDPWSVRIGVGGEEERGVPEPRARRVGVGASWFLDSTVLDLGVLHRSIRRAGQPDSGEDRVLFALVQKF